MTGSLGGVLLLEQMRRRLHTTSGLTSSRSMDRMALPYVSTTSWHSCAREVGSSEHTLSRPWIISS